MNTSGHHSVAIEAGLPVLLDAVNRAGKADAPLHAFYLGNWITDVSQAVDPVAYASLVRKLRCGLQSVRDSAPGLIKGKLTQLDSDLGALLNRFFKPPGGGKEALRRSEAGEAFREIFRVAGFFKFACPHQPGSMDPDAYVHVYDKLYGQYYPHEHMDRPEKQHTPSEGGAGGRPFNWDQPECPPPKMDLTMKVAEGTRSKRRQEKLSPDLYSFLRDDIEMVAGLLAELDREWARKYLQPGGPPVDLEWHLGLGRLGYALHPIEDFFAHSNFVEHAVRTLPKADFDRLVPDESGTVYRKRLKKFVTEKHAEAAGWEQGPDEPHVVSGFFDFYDTLVSLAHVGEHLFLKRHGPVAPTASNHDHPHADEFLTEAQERADVRHAREQLEASEKCSTQCKKLLGDLLQYVSDRRLAEQDPDNDVVRFYKGRTPPGGPRQIARDVATSHPLFKGVPDTIKQSFEHGVELFSKTGQLGGQSVSLYRALKLVSDAVHEPITLLNYFFREVLHLPELAAFLVSTVAQAFYNQVAASRIGCHSLMAKDHGPDGLLYNEQRQCALAVHWYVVSTLCRWSAPKRARVCRAPNDASGKKNLNLLDTPQWIDWLELLEFYLRHPATAPKGGQVLGVRANTIHYTVTDKDSFASLAEKFRSQAVNPAAFTWKTIAEENYQTSVPAEINRQMKVREQGILLADGINYKFKPGIVIRIPGLKFEIPPAEAPVPERAWHRHVMKSGWQVIQEPQQCLDEQKRPFNRHTLIYINPDEVDDLIKRGKDLRTRADNAYVPG